jgi:hypothetical protein
MLARYYWHRYPRRITGFGGAFNGQWGRCAMFCELNAMYSFELIIETGTYMGTTTAFLATNSGARVVTIESDELNYLYARVHLETHARVRLIHGNSASALPELVDGLEERPRHPFFYLDAHWEEYLPLAEEVATAFGSFAEPIVMIDDFRVPDDAGYAYDSYPAGALTEEWLRGKGVLDGLAVGYPNLPSRLESGRKRGGCVLMRRETRERAPGFAWIRFV